jgi:hypothetical protein
MKSTVYTKPSIMNMLVRTGHAFVAAEGKDPAEAGAELADYIRKGNLDDYELELIAQLVTGYWRREQNGSPGVSTLKKQAAVDEYYKRAARYGRGCAAIAKDEVACEFNITGSQLKHWITWANGRKRIPVPTR